MSGLSQPDWTRRLAKLSVRAALLLLAPVASLLPAAAQCTVPVTSLADSGTGSLRAAIAANPGAHICVTATGTIALQSTLTFTSGVTVSGLGAGSLTLSGGNSVQPVVVNATNTATTPVVLQQLSISGGTSTIGGGVRVATGFAQLTQVTVSGNSAEAGGGVYNQGTLAISSSTINGNTATAGVGAGITNLSGGTLTLDNTFVFGNTNVEGPGGGISNSGTLTIVGGTIGGSGQGNTATNGGGISNSGTLNISGGAVISDNAAADYGGGVYIAAGATAAISSSLFEGNQSTGGGAYANGGGIYNLGTLSISESTLAANASNSLGGGIYNQGALTLADATISTNTSTSFGSGVYNNLAITSTSLTANNTIVSGNVSGAGSYDCTGCTLTGVANMIGGDAGLGPLANNGGPTLTFMPLPGSVVIGAGNAYDTTDTTDERGLSRLTNGGLDQGAVETHYSSVTFATQPVGSETAGQTITPSINVTVAEVDGSTTNYPLGVPVTMLLQAQDSDGTPVLSGGGATYPTASTNPPTAQFAGLSINTAGSYYLQATTYPSSHDGQVATYSSLSGSFAVGQGLTQTQTGLSIAPNPPVYGQSEVLTAIVTVYGTGTAVPSGSVSFTDNGAALGTVQVSNTGMATLTIAPLTVGQQHVLVASYTGTSTYGASGGGGTFTVAKTTPTVTLATPGTVLPGAVLSLANVHATATGMGGAVLAGTFVYSPALGTTLTSGETVTVTFTPTDTTDYVSGASAQTTVAVLAAQTTTTTLTPSANPVLPGVTVGLTANVTPAPGTAGAVPGTEAFSVTSAGSAFKSVNLVLDPATANFKASPVQTYTGPYDYNTYSADLNGDGVADLLVVPDGGLPQLLLSVPGAAPSLAAAVQLNLGSTCNYVIGLAVGDMNGDGLPDIAAACVNDSSGATTLVVVLNEGGGNFVPSSTVTTLSPGISSVQMVLGNFIKTGVQGLVVLTDCYEEEGCTPTLDYLQGDGAGNFSLVNYELINNGGASDSFANLLSGDFNGDGYPDVAFLHTSNASPYGVVEVWTNSGGSQPTFGQLLSSAGPTYQYSATIAAGNGSATLYSLVSADLNLDGKPDLALTTAVTSSDGSDAYSSISIALNQSTNGVLSFPSATTDTQGHGAVSSIVTADFDGDKVPDIALYDSYNSTVRVLHGTVGQGGSYSFAFTEPNLLFTVSAPSNLPVDIVHPLVGGHPGKKSSGLKPADSVIGDLIYPVLAVGDTNGDGYPDLLVGQVTTDQQTYNLIYQAQQFVTSGPSVGSTSITAPNGTTEYTAGTTPSSGFWAPSTGATTLSVTSLATTTSLAVPPGSPVYGTAFTLSSQVINTATGLPAAGGSVTFTEDGTAFSTVTIDASGKATSTSVMPTTGTHAFGASYGGATGEGTSTATSQTVTVAKFTPTLNWAAPAAITTTTPLSGTQLDATVAGVTGAALPGVFTYTPASGTLTVGTHTLSVSFAPTDAVDYGTATAQVSIQVVAETITLVSISPATTPLGTTPLPVTVTGSGFPAGSVVELNGTALPTMAISATQLGVTVPAANLAKAGTLSFTIYDAASKAISNAATLSVTAPAATAVVSVPATTTSAQQPTVGITLANSYPVDITGTFTLTFAPTGAAGVDDPAVQFSSGGRTLNFTIAAGSTTGPTAQLQSGTVEGTIQVATVLTAGGVDVTPADLQTPAAITVAGSAPTVTGVTFTNTNGLITVAVTGFSNTREMTEANFVFTGPGADSLASAGVTVPATSLFGSWYTSAGSATYGSTFLYTQTFQLSDDTTNITGVAVTLTNTVGSSTSVSSQ